MKYLYLISQNANSSYGAIRSAVVSADSEEEARAIHPAANGLKVPEKSYKGFCMSVTGELIKINTCQVVMEYGLGRIMSRLN